MNDLSLSARHDATAAVATVELSRGMVPGPSFNLADPDHD